MATFEHAVATSSGFPTAKGPGARGYIDLLWKGVILVEHKSRGKDLEKAYRQAKDYFPGLTEKELPRYILVSDFERFKLYDLDDDKQYEFNLSQFADHVHLFGFIAGYQKRTYKEQDPVNIEAAELMGRLHDKLKAIGYEAHALELYLVRLVFLLFADDTNIFEKGILYDYLDLQTKPDGSDLAAHLSQLFEILNQPKEKRLRNIDESLNAFPYVNGKLFEERLPIAAFDSEMRKILMNCCLLDWGKISPAIFGSLFQSVMDAKARRNLGAHYTSEKNILKLIKPLFLDELYTEYKQVKDSKARLQKFHDKISKLRFLDPACGCGNFLIIAYRELRLLEIEIIKTLLFKHEKLRAEVAADAGIDVGLMIKCDVDRFYGIEYEEFPAQIAQVAMWLADHQMNQLVSNTFGNYYVRLPLRKSATIVQGNALQVDWHSLIDAMPWEKGVQKYDYIFGNPPFIGTAYQNEEQKEDTKKIFYGVGSLGMLDYVTNWYMMAAKYMQEHNIFLSSDEGNAKLSPAQTKAAYVSTNSISQGEQVGVLWNELYNKYKVKIHFAHRTFSWSNEARGNAAVHVVIIGFANYDVSNKVIYEYESIKAEPHEIIAKNINPYLVEGKDTFLNSISLPICKVPRMQSGSAARDGGFLITSDDEKKVLCQKNPSIGKHLRRFISGDDFINNIKRWCIWLKNETPTVIRQLKEFHEKFDEVKNFRNNSTRAGTKKMADFPYLFAEERQPEHDFLLIPKVSSENRRFIPIAYLTKDFIVSDKTFVVPSTTSYHFGVLTSTMHMTWTRYVCGRMKSDYSYSNTIVYNNFPWPENPTEKQIQAVETAAQQVLDARAQFPDASLADLYDPNTMPPVLVKAHQQLDKAVDLCYRPQPFINETKRIEFLFELYDKYVGGMFGEEKGKGTNRK